MPESPQHRRAAQRIAKKYGTTYNYGAGIDVETNDKAIEVETVNTVDQGLKQLRGYRKRVYIAGANKKATEKAKEVTKNTTVGVIDNYGNIIKGSSRSTS